MPTVAAQPATVGLDELLENSESPYSQFFAKRPSQVLQLESDGQTNGRSWTHQSTGEKLEAKAKAKNISPDEVSISETLVETLNTGFANGWLKSDSGKPDDIEATQAGIDNWRSELEEKFPPECFELSNIGASWKGWEVDIDLICSEERVNELMMERLEAANDASAWGTSATSIGSTRPLDSIRPLDSLWEASDSTVLDNRFEDRETQQDIPELPWIEGREFWCVASMVGVAFGVIGVIAFLAMTGPAGALAWLSLAGGFFSIITGWIGMVINCTGIIAAWNDPNRAEWQAAGSHYVDRTPQAWYECTFQGYFSKGAGSNWKWDDIAGRWVPVQVTYNC